MEASKMELTSARPYPYRFRPESTALLIIDMQRDFLDPNGFGAIQCGNEDIFRNVRNIVPKTKQVLQAARELGLYVVHTREGHKPDLSDLPPSKRLRQTSAPSGHHTLGIGDQGPMGRLLVRGEYGHDIIDELQPVPGETVIDKPGKGSFWDTTLHRVMLARGITHLLIAGVTTECCVNTTFREAADRGFECCVLTDCTSGFDSSFVTKALDMLCSYDGLFGFVADSAELLKHIKTQAPTPPITPPGFQGDLSISSLRSQYKKGLSKPTEVAKTIAQWTLEYQVKDPAVFIFLQCPEALLEAAEGLERTFQGKPLPPLYGVPFAVKDNIDVAGIQTTAACAAAAYTPTKNAPVVDALLKAGALFVGKTNMDQLATGLSGCRSPFGTPRSVYGHDRIPGGSSSGSAVAVAAGLVSFALGTDTAGSGRTPAFFNGICGYKPTKGTLSARGVVPACKSLDTISIFASTSEEARAVWLAADQGPDPSDAYAKTQQSLPLWHADFRGVKQGGFTFGVPPTSLLEICTTKIQNLYTEATARLQRAGGTAQELDWTPFAGGTRLLYGGALVQERVQCIGPEFLKTNMASLHPALRDLFTAVMNRDSKPYDVFRDLQQQAEYTRQAAAIFQNVDVLLVPTTTCHPTVAEMEADAVELNFKLGEFTNFGNVLDLCGIAVPAGFYSTSNGERLPFGVTILGASGTDGKVFDIAREFERTK